tara:strand:+ start:1357 stop:2718 length:1362 start_codon:yes stop_codon:yes gene_type:complete
MDGGEYKGDSDGKKLVRALLWHKCMLTMQAIRTPYRGSFVLSGHGGDISVLEGLGVSPTTVVGAEDKFEHVAHYCRELHPGSTHIFGEAGDIARKGRDRYFFDPPLQRTLDYNAVHLDFNNGLTPKNLRTILDVATHGSSYPLFLGVTMQRGREFQAGVKDKGLLYEGLRRADRRALVSWSKKNDPIGHHLLTTLRQNPFDARKLLRMTRKILMDRIEQWHREGAAREEVARMLYKKNGDSTPLGGVFLRGHLLAQCLNSLFYAHYYGLFAVPVFCYGYTSHNETSEGTAFGTYGLAILPRQHLDFYQGILRGGNNLTRPFVGVFKVQEGHDLIRPYALAMDKLYGGKQAAAILDVSRGRLAAWKAHQTMGTYPPPVSGSFLDYQIHHAVEAHAETDESELEWLPTLGWGSKELFAVHPDEREKWGRLCEKGESASPAEVGGSQAKYIPPWKT